jgi:hypothetical protein
MATLAEPGGINDETIFQECGPLRKLRRHYLCPDRVPDEVDLGEIMDGKADMWPDLFDAVQLRAVIALYRQSKIMSYAGRELFSVSRDAKASRTTSTGPGISCAFCARLEAGKRIPIIQATARSGLLITADRPYFSPPIVAGSITSVNGIRPFRNSTTLIVD